MRPRTWLHLAALAALLAIPSLGRADDLPARSPEALGDDPLITQGVELRKRGQDAAALALFRQANDLHPSARAVAQIALAEQALAQWLNAEASLREALSHTDDEWIARQRVYLESSLAAVQSHLASLTVESNLTGAEVWLDGQFVGRTPLPDALRVLAGEVLLELRTSRSSPLTRTVTVAAGARVVEVFTLIELPAGPIRSSDSRPAPLPPIVPAGRGAGWALATGAGALLLVGVAGMVIREWEARTYDDDMRCGPSPGQSRDARCGTNRDLGNAAEGAAVVAFAGAGLAAAGAAILLFGSRANVRPDANRVACQWNGTSFGCTGSF